MSALEIPAVPVTPEDYERNEFLGLVFDGTPPELAGFEMGWPPARLRRELADPGFAEMVVAMQERALDSIERTVFEMARNRNMAAIQMVLLNLRSGKWRDVKHIEHNVTGTVSVSQVQAVKQAALEMMTEHGVEQLQLGGSLGGDDDIIDAELIELDTDG